MDELSCSVLDSVPALCVLRRASDCVRTDLVRSDIWHNEQIQLYSEASSSCESRLKLRHIKVMKLRNEINQFNAL